MQVSVLNSISIPLLRKMRNNGDQVYWVGAPPKIQITGYCHPIFIFDKLCTHACVDN